jgi:hypothetical protein
VWVLCKILFSRQPITRANHNCIGDSLLHRGLKRSVARERAGEFGSVGIPATGEEGERSLQRRSEEAGEKQTE